MAKGGRVLPGKKEIPGLITKYGMNQAGWCSPVILVLKVQRQENQKLKVILSNTVTSRKDQPRLCEILSS